MLSAKCRQRNNQQSHIHHHHDQLQINDHFPGNIGSPIGFLCLFVEEEKLWEINGTGLSLDQQCKLHATSDPSFHQSRTAQHTSFTNCCWCQTFFICCSSHLEQTNLHRSICRNYRKLSYQTEDTPISRHCVIDICYPLFVKLAVNIRLD